MHHIGIIVSNIEADKRLYIALGYEPCGETATDNSQNNRLLFLRNKISGEVIELIEPMDETSSVGGLQKGYAHVCYETHSIDECVAMFKKERLGVFFTEKMRAPALNNRTIAFAMLKTKTIVEFIEED